MNPTSKDQAPHYIWGDQCDGWKLVTSDTLAVIEERMPPGTTEVRHYHRAARQFFYVLGGKLTIEVAGQTFDLETRQGIEIPPEVPHQVSNRSAQPVEFLVISSPPSQDDRVAV